METADLSHHILSRYNADLEGVRTGVLQMGGLVEQQLQPRHQSDALQFQGHGLVGRDLEPLQRGPVEDDGEI